MEWTCIQTEASTTQCTVTAFVGLEYVVLGIGLILSVLVMILCSNLFRRV